MTGLALAASLAVAPGARAGVDDDIRVKESKGRIKAAGPGFTLKLTRHGIVTQVVDEEFGDPSTGEPVTRSTLDLAGRTLRPFVCDNGTYTVTGGAFKRTFRFSSRERRPAPYPEQFHTGFPGLVTPFLGEFDATVTDAAGETLRVLISDLAYETWTPGGGFRSTAPIHGFVVDAKGRIRDRISLFGHFRSGPGGANAKYWIEDRGTCHQTADYNWGPGTDRVVVTGPLLVFPFNSPVVTPRK
ncbi:hypothetical protein [Spirillospora sp. NPDC047279]|uniref:hypothetical protein n=1 Tax=Spirillospora sp. NPDC047279 TaxID=3155478 RepID=UPI003402B5B4